MPLVRFEVRNEYGMGDPELYRGGGAAAKREEPKALLDGVAVAGLVGILRQLGDLAEFAADVFHDLHEQVVTTAARGRQVMTRVQNIEAALPSLEKAVKSQTSHIHFAYVPGSDWHAHFHTEKNHLLSSDLPRFMMDSYEECRDPPRLYLLDKFDNAGAGACLKRYSDPSYFKRAWNMAKTEKGENVRREKRAQKIKRKGSRLRNGDDYHVPSTSRLRNGELQHVLGAAQHSSRRFASPSTDAQSISENRSTPDVRSNLEILSRSSSSGSKTRLCFVDQVLDTNCVVTPDESSYNKLSDAKPQNRPSDASPSSPHGGNIVDGSNDNSRQDFLSDQTVPTSSSVTWDEKVEIVVPTSPISCGDIIMDKVQDAESVLIDTGQQEIDHKDMENLEQHGILLQNAKMLLLSSGLNNHDEVTSETDNYMDALNTLESETETEAECQTKKEVKAVPNSNLQGSQNGATRSLVSEHADLSDSEVPNTSLTSSKAVEYMHLSSTGPSEIAEPILSAYTNGIPPNVESLDVNDISESDAQDASGENVDEGINCSLSSEPTISNVQTMFTNDPFEKASAAQNSPDTTRNMSSDISESDAQDSARKNGEEDVSCDVPTDPSVLNMQPISASESLEKVPASQDFPVSTCTSLGVSSTKLWTNAGLFGLEPSKPPDFGAQNGLRENMLPLSKEPVHGCSNDSRELHHANIPESEVVEATNGNVSITSNIVGKLVGMRPNSASHNSSGTDQSAVRIPNVVQPNEALACSTSHDHTQHNNMIDQNSSLRELEKTRDDPEDSVLIHPKPDMDKKGETSLVSDSPLISKSDPEYSHPFDNNKSISSSFSSIAQRFLANTLQRKSSPNYADPPMPSGRVNSDASGAEESTLFGNHNATPNGAVPQASQFQQKKEKAIHGSSKMSVSSRCHYSEQSSPPLEYMKISFHPMNASEMSKMKLEFSNGNLQEDTDDLMLPTFQLLPESSFPLPESGSESEDDTFCRSYSYSSYDDLSPHLYSNSELWDQDERIGLEEYELYNDSNRIESLTTPISSYMGLEQNFSGVNRIDGLAGTEVCYGSVTFESLPAGELPNFDSVMSISNRQHGFDAPMSCNPANLPLEYQNQMPPPPPLPPMQWRMTRPTSSQEDTDTQTENRLKKVSSLPPLHITSDEKKEQFAPTAPSFAPSLLLQHAKKLHNQNVEVVKETNHFPDMMEIKAREDLLQQIRDKPELKLNGHEKPKTEGLGVKNLDEREELLHQIRSKTFNLRRMHTSKPSATSETTANSNVVAILEKANAIRQAVASDEGGDDDNWSDM